MPGAERLIDYVAMAVFAAIAIIALFTFRDYGLGWDDYTHAQYGQLLVDYYSSGLFDRRAFNFVNLYMYGGGFDMVAALLDKALPLTLFEIRRLLGAAVGIAGLFFVWRIARRLGGNAAGLIALLLLAACPTYYGDMFINAKDVPFAVAMAASLLALVRAIEEYPKPSTATLALAGIAFGLAIGARILAGFAVLYAVIPFAMLLIHFGRSEGSRHALRDFGRFALRFVPALILTILIMGLVWPWSVQAPLNLFRALQYFSHFFEIPWRELYGGELIPVPDMPRSYLPVQFGLRFPLIFIAFALGGMAFILATAFRGSVPIRRRCALVLILCAATFPVIVSIVTHPAMYNGIRHMIFILPALAVCGGLFGGWLLQKLREVSPIAAVAAACAMLVGFALPVREMARLHPYEYVHFNELIGGAKGAQGLYMLDYWSLSLKQGADALLAVLKEKGEKPPKGKQWKIAVCGSHSSARVALGKKFDVSWSVRNADFAMALNTFYCINDVDAPLIAQIERDGVVFAKVYDLRGHPIPSIVTMPRSYHE